MRVNFSRTMALLLFSTIVAVHSGCDDSLEFSNNPPSGLEITRDICFLGPDDSVNLVGEATDVDGDSISYSWTAAEGTLTPADGKGRGVSWQAPSSHGTYRVTLKASDGIDDTSKGINLDVGRNLELLHDGGVLDQTDYPYIVPNIMPLFISDLITVRIEAGVTVIFNATTGGFNVAGTLVINGTEQDRVLLMPNKCPGEDRVWDGVKFNGAQAGGTLSYVTVSSASDGIAVENEAVVVADNIIIDQTSGDGVSVKSGGNLTLSDSKIWENGNGVYVANGTLLLQTTSIRYNGNYGVSMVSNAGTFDVLIRDCVVASNDQYGFVIAGYAKPVINNCSLFLNGPMGYDGRAVMISSGYTGSGSIDMTGNYWGVTTAIEIGQQIEYNGASVVVDYSGWLTEPPASD